MGKKIFTQARGECKEAGKKMYCKDCEKSIDYFEVFENNQSKTTTLIHIIKAYTWNDVIKFVKDKYFKDQNNLLTFHSLWRLFFRQYFVKLIP